jgi:hypothetical protein
VRRVRAPCACVDPGKGPVVDQAATNSTRSIDPLSFNQTIENIFYLSFSIAKGVAARTLARSLLLSASVLRFR